MRPPFSLPFLRRFLAIPLWAPVDMQTSTESASLRLWEALAECFVWPSLLLSTLGVCAPPASALRDRHWAGCARPVRGGRGSEESPCLRCGAGDRMLPETGEGRRWEAMADSPSVSQSGQEENRLFSSADDVCAVVVRPSVACLLADHSVPPFQCAGSTPPRPSQQ